VRQSFAILQKTVQISPVLRHVSSVP
jgi:hypothetical protein